MNRKKYSKHYVYTYFKDGVPYYVGMGKNNRYRVKHLYVDVPAQENIIVVDNLTEGQAWDLEISLIAEYGKISNSTGILQNLTDGGKTQKSGWNQSEQAKSAISVGNTGKVRTAVHKENYSGPKTAEHANNIRLANLGRKDDGRNAKISATMKGRPWPKARRDAQNRKIRENA